MSLPFSAPAMITWQLTYDCNLACLHCCTDSAPGRAMERELSREEALDLASQIVEAQVPYTMICGGEPTIIPHFLDVARRLGQGGVWLKIETNGQTLAPETARELSRLPIRSIQISLDGATQETYSRMRPGASLQKALEACALVRAHAMPLEITFAPARFNIQEAEAVIGKALELGAFRFNTGALMRLGRAAKLWDRIAPADADYAPFRELLSRKKKELSGRIEIMDAPFSISDEFKSRLSGASSPATMLVLPNGHVRLAGPLPVSVADLRGASLLQAWSAFQQAWSHPSVIAAVDSLAEGASLSNIIDLPAPQKAGAAA